MLELNRFGKRLQPQKVFKSIIFFLKSHIYFLVSILPAESLASASAMKTKFGSFMYTRPLDSDQGICYQQKETEITTGISKPPMVLYEI